MFWIYHNMHFSFEKCKGLLRIHKIKMTWKSSNMKIRIKLLPWNHYSSRESLIKGNRQYNYLIQSSLRSHPLIQSSLRSHPLIQSSLRSHPLLVPHANPFGKSKFNHEAKSLTASTLLHQSPVHRARYSTNWDRKGWPGSEILMYYGCQWTMYQWYDFSALSHTNMRNAFFRLITRNHTVKPLITNTSEEFIKCRLHNFQWVYTLLRKFQYLRK